MPDTLPFGAVFGCVVGADCHPDSTCHDEGEESVKEKNRAGEAGKTIDEEYGLDDQQRG